ncbi:MAG: hypothetical protein Ct9H90mP3_4940 [Flammeovirgaceae bacterium]|nr:MAG: hypothetical protein Ct9H90mP3_4940 [Flammeovirgaceae bacterium]
MVQFQFPIKKNVSISKNLGEHVTVFSEIGSKDEKKIIPP